MSPMWPGAGLAEGGEQGAGSAQHQPVGEQALAGAVAVAGRPRRPGAGSRGGGLPVGVDEVLVLEPEHRPAAHGQVPAAGQALGVEPGGPVEGLGHRARQSTTSGSWSGPETARRPMWNDSPSTGVRRCRAGPRRAGSGSRSMRPK